MNTTLIKTILALAGLCGLAAEAAAAGDQEKIQGTWTLQTASMLGKTMPKVAVVYVFTGDTLTIHPAAGKEDKATFTLDQSANPKVLLVQRAQHAPNAKPDRSPYELDGDTLKISFPSPDEHPTAVSDDGQVLFTLKRTKP